MPRGGAGRLDAESETLIPTSGGVFDVAHSLRGEGFDASEDGTGRGTPLVPVAFPANLSGTQHASTENLAPSMGAKNPTAIAQTLTANGGQGGRQDKQPMTAVGSQVRRLTPRECERLQGFPDDYTNIPITKFNRHGSPTRTKPAADGPRYKALGNSWAVPCAAWIGRRIEAVQAVTELQELAA